jgi:hypothetical protein
MRTSFLSPHILLFSPLPVHGRLLRQRGVPDGDRDQRDLLQPEGLPPQRGHARRGLRFRLRGLLPGYERTAKERIERKRVTKERESEGKKI